MFGERLFSVFSTTSEPFHHEGLAVLSGISPHSTPLKWGVLIIEPTILSQCALSKAVVPWDIRTHICAQGTYLTSPGCWIELGISHIMAVVGSVSLSLAMGTSADSQCSIGHGCHHQHMANETEEEEITCSSQDLLDARDRWCNTSFPIYRLWIGVWLSGKIYT